MSYSIGVRAASIATAKAIVADKLDEMVVSQPIHAADRAQAEAAFAAFAGVLGEPSEGFELAATISGYVSYTVPDEAVNLASVMVQISMVPITS